MNHPAANGKQCASSASFLPLVQELRRRDVLTKGNVRYWEETLHWSPALVLFLASAASNYITGTPIWIDRAESLLKAECSEPTGPFRGDVRSP